MTIIGSPSTRTMGSQLTRIPEARELPLGLMGLPVPAGAGDAPEEAGVVRA